LKGPVGIVVTLLNGSGKVVILSARAGINIPRIRRDFPQVVKANARRVSRLAYDRLLPNYFQFKIHLPPYHSTLYGLLC
jgi:hypothetical protein